MKRLLLYIIIITFFSCDHPAYHDYYIENECDKNIVVNIVDAMNSRSSITVKPLTKELVYHGETIIRVGESGITTFLKVFDIYKEGVKINIDPLDYRLWQYESSSQYFGTSVLSVKPEYFSSISDSTSPYPAPLLK